MSDHKPFADRLSEEVDAFFRLWRNRRWLAVIFLIVLVGIAVYSTIGWLQRGVKIDSLTTDNRDLKRDVRQLEAENKGLRETVAPLIARAAKEFPGEEINISLKKIIERLEKNDPLRQPIASATATILLTIKSDENASTHNMDRGGHVVFGKGSSALLETSSHESWEYQTGRGEVVYRGVFPMFANDVAVGKPIDSLTTAEYLQAEFEAMPTNSLVFRGEIIFVINNTITLHFDVPEQRTDDQRRVFIRDLSKGLKPITNR